MIKYVLYDLDGVLVDACDWHYYSLNSALQEVCGFSIPYDEHIAVYNGLPTKAKLDLLHRAGLVQPEQFDAIFHKKQANTKDAIEKHGRLDAVKMRLHRATNSLGIVSGCVTNSIRETATLMLQKTGQLRFMKILICNEDIAKPKPDPMPFLTAMERLGASPSETLIIEDSDKGMEAAMGSGAWVQRVKNPSEVTPENVLEWIKSHA